MADAEQSSFVNQNFDELQSEGSKDSLPQNQSSQEDQSLEEFTQTPTDITQGNPSTTETPTSDDRDDGVAVLHLSSEEPPSDKSNPFVTHSPMPKTKNTSPLVAPSLAVASVDNDDESDDSDHRPLPHITSPPPNVYEELPPNNELRHTTEDEYDLRISITGHEKQVISKTDSCIIYKITTTSLRPRHLFDKSEYTVFRRYRDFEWLHLQLERTYPTLILPPLPGKQIMRLLDHKNELFLEERQKCLDQFLWRLALHPYYSYDYNFKMFLSANTEAFTTHAESTTTSGQLLGMMSSSVKLASTSMRLKNPDPHFVPHGKYFHNLSVSFGVLDRIETRLASERAGLASTNEDMSSLVYSWSNSEAQLAEPIRKMAGIFEANASALSSLNQSNSSSFQLAIRMYQLYSNSGASAVKRREALQLEYEIACEERDKKKKVHNEAVTAGKTDKLQKLAADMEKTGVTAEHAQDELMKSNEQLRVDIEKWLESKDIQLEEIYRIWADNHVQYHERMFHEWEELLVMLRKLGQDATNLVPGDDSAHVYESM